MKKNPIFPRIQDHSGSLTILLAKLD
ncbi:hypothetical protein LINPERHAP2_LOCUS34436 [Linum perenne]